MRLRTLRLLALVAVAAAPAVFFVLARRSLVEFRGLHPGEHLPVARIVSREGRVIDTRSWRGAPLVLILFQADCGACAKEIESLVSLVQSFPHLRVALLSVDSRSKADLPVPVYFDPSGEFLSKVRKLVVPTVYWIDAGGKVEHVRCGRGSVAEEEARFRTLLLRGN